MKMLKVLFLAMTMCVIQLGSLSAEEAPVILDDALKAAVRDQVEQDAKDIDAQARMAQKENEMLEQSLQNLKGIEDMKLAMENKVCPVTGKSFSAGATYVEVEWEGGVYRVCADGCKEKFLADPEKYAKIVEQEVGSIF